MHAQILLLAMSAAFGAFVGTLYRLSRRPGYQRPLLFTLVGVVAGVTGFLLYQLLVWVTGAPAWLLPLLVALQVWLWLGPLGPASRRPRRSHPGR